MKADIGVIGGSGFYELLKKPELVRVETPFGPPSSQIALGKVSGKNVAFLPRHGVEHELPPSNVPYKANIWALKAVGVERIIAVTACGSLQKNIKRGDFVVLSQFIDRTRHRDDTYFIGPVTTHVSSAEPYCLELSEIAYRTGKNLKIKIHKEGTVVVIEGPRFSTLAESSWFTKMGWDVVNMTGYPEVILARELELCYASIALVTDYDAGIASSEKIKPVTTDEILKNLNQATQKAKRLVLKMIERIPERAGCKCFSSLDQARIGRGIRLWPKRKKD